MRARLLSLVLLVACAGCAAEAAGTRLGHLGTASGGRWMLVKQDDFPGGDASRGKPTTPGSHAVRDAVIADRGMAEFVAAHGVPDAIAVDGLGFTLYFAYLRDGKAYTLEHSAAEWFSPRAWNPSRVTGERPLRAEELALIDPDQRAQRLRTHVAQYSRLQAVGRTVLGAAPPLGEPFYEYGVLLLPAYTSVARAFGGEAREDEQVAVWVDPDGPLHDALRVGDRVTAVDGVGWAVAQRTGVRWDTTKRLTVVRDGQSFEIEATPVIWPHRVRVELLDSPQPNAFVVPGGDTLYVTSALLELLPEDDALATVIGHELAHIALGHADRPSKTTALASGVLALGMLPVLLPAEIARPGTSGQVRQAIESGFNRDQERDADRLGIRYARDAGYDPRAALLVVDRLQDRAPTGGLDAFFDLHPPYPERRALIAAEVEPH